MVRKESAPEGTTVMFKEYACALEGMPQATLAMLNGRTCAAAREGPPKGPVGLRVSATRQGVTG